MCYNFAHVCDVWQTKMTGAVQMWLIFLIFFCRENKIPYRKENIKIESVDLLKFWMH